MGSTVRGGEVGCLCLLAGGWASWCPGVGDAQWEHPEVLDWGTRKLELGKRKRLDGLRESQKGKNQGGHPQVCLLSRQTCFCWWPGQRPQ